MLIILRPTLVSNLMQLPSLAQISDLSTNGSSAHTKVLTWGGGGRERRLLYILALVWLHKYDCGLSGVSKYGSLLLRNGRYYGTAHRLRRHFFFGLVSGFRKSGNRIMLNFLLIF